jgi:hypothetical protein
MIEQSHIGFQTIRMTGKRYEPESPRRSGQGRSCCSSVSGFRRCAKDMAKLTQMFAILSQARGLLKRCEINEAPVDLTKLARQQEIREIRVDRSVLNGELRRLKSGGYVVRLDARDSEERRRFTLAHEIAHTLLISSSDKTALHNCEDERTEELCDFAGAELLVPDQLLRRTRLQLDIHTILSIANEFRCSIEAASWKLLNTLDFKGALILWKMHKVEGVLIASAVATPRTVTVSLPFVRGMVVREGDPNWRAIVDGGEVVELQANNDPSIRYSAERRRLRGGIIATLIRLASTKLSSTSRPSARQTNLFEAVKVIRP